jgi:hypothetical protein
MLSKLRLSAVDRDLGSLLVVWAVASTVTPWRNQPFGMTSKAAARVGSLRPHDMVSRSTSSAVGAKSELPSLKVWAVALVGTSGSG